MSSVYKTPVNIPLFCTLPPVDTWKEKGGWTLIEKLQNEPLSCKEALLSEDLTDFLSKEAWQQIPTYQNNRQGLSREETLLDLLENVEKTDKEILLKGLINLYQNCPFSIQKKIESILHKEWEFCTTYADTLIWEIQSLEGWKMTYVESPSLTNTHSLQIEKIITLIRHHLEILFPNVSPKLQRKIDAYKR